MPGTGPRVVSEQTSDSRTQRAAHSPGGTGFPVGSGLPPRMAGPIGGAVHGDLLLFIGIQVAPQSRAWDHSLAGGTFPYCF